MKKLIALTIFINGIVFCFPQTPFVIAGQTDGMNLTRVVPGIPVPFNVDTDLHTMEGLQRFLIDTPASSAITFKLSGYWSAGGAQYIVLLNLVNLSVYGVYNDSVGYDGTSIFAGLNTRFYAAGDTMQSTQDSLWLSGNNINIINYALAGGGYSGDTGLIEHSDRRYFFIRIADSTDTIYGYCNVTFNYIGLPYQYFPADPVLQCFALQGPQKVDTILALPEPGRVPDLQIYPNPFSEYLRVKGVENYNYLLCDLTGKRLLEGNNTSVINTSSIAQGAYLFFIESNGRRICRKLIKTE